MKKQTLCTVCVIFRLVLSVNAQVAFLSVILTKTSQFELNRKISWCLCSVKAFKVQMRAKKLKRFIKDR